MATPLEPQYIPEEFQDEIDLPEVDEIDQSAMAGLNAQLRDADRLIAAYERAIHNHSFQLKRTDIDANSRKLLNAALKERKARLADAKAQRRKVTNNISEQQADFGSLLQGEDRDAYESLKALFTGYGLESLAPKILEYVQEGYGADTIGLLLQDTAEYKERFKANDARKKAGLSVLTPAEYLATEAAYRQILEGAGMPKGFYDNNADFRNWIAADVAPTEIKGRVELAQAATSQSSPSYRAALHEMYGINEQELTAYFLDRGKAEPILKKQAAAASIGAAAMRRGIRTDAGLMESYATAGITGQEAEEAYGRISQGLESMLGIAGRYGSTWSLGESEKLAFGLGGEEKAKRLLSQERAQFASSPAATDPRGLSAGHWQTA